MYGIEFWVFSFFGNVCGNELIISFWWVFSSIRVPFVIIYVGYCFVTVDLLQFRLEFYSTLMNS